MASHPESDLPTDIANLNSEQTTHCSPLHYFTPSQGSIPLSIEDLTKPQSLSVSANVLEGIPSMVAVFDLNLKYIYANQRYVDMVNSDKPTWRGLTLEEYLPEHLHPIVLPRIRRAASEVLGVRYRLNILGKDQAHCVVVSYQPIFNRVGEPEFLIMTGSDVTELAAAEEKLAALQKFELVAQLVSGIAHDFNNFLSVITGASYLAQKKIDNPEALAQIKTIDKVVDKAVALTSQLMSYGGKQMLRPTVLSVRETLEAIQALLRTSLRDNIHLSFDFGSDSDHIRVDKTQFESAVLNLMLNARDAMPNGGTLTIKTRPATRSETAWRPAELTDLEPQGVLLEIQDTGVGMTPEIARKAFEPFFTTKSPGQGSGMGLAMVYGFLKQSGGDIELKTSIDRGACFRLYFPRVEAADDCIRDAEIRPPATWKRLSVLLVEDDPDVADTMKNMIEEIGHTCHRETAAHDALAWLDTHAGATDVLLTDVNLSGPSSGLELCSTVKSRYPKIHIVCMSAMPQDLTLHGDVLFLSKPILESTLLDALHAI